MSEHVYYTHNEFFEALSHMASSAVSVLWGINTLSHGLLVIVCCESPPAQRASRTHTGHTGGTCEHLSETKNEKWDTLWSCGLRGHVRAKAMGLQGHIKMIQRCITKTHLLKSKIRNSLELSCQYFLALMLINSKNHVYSRSLIFFKKDKSVTLYFKV